VSITYDQNGFWGSGLSSRMSNYPWRNGGATAVHNVVTQASHHTRFGGGSLDRSNLSKSRANAIRARYPRSPTQPSHRSVAPRHNRQPRTGDQSQDVQPPRSSPPTGNSSARDTVDGQLELPCPPCPECRGVRRDPTHSHATCRPVTVTRQLSNSASDGPHDGLAVDDIKRARSEANQSQPAYDDCDSGCWGGFKVDFG
jgi:hypothetical protein